MYGETTYARLILPAVVASYPVMSPALARRGGNLLRAIPTAAASGDARRGCEDTRGKMSPHPVGSIRSVPPVADDDKHLRRCRLWRPDADVPTVAFAVRGRPAQRHDEPDDCEPSETDKNQQHRFLETFRVWRIYACRTAPAVSAKAVD